MSNLDSASPGADVVADGAGPSPDPGVVGENEDAATDGLGGEGDNIVADAAEAMENAEAVDGIDRGDMMDDQGMGKRVKVYELRDQAWFDRGTGRCKGVYDDRNDAAVLIVEPERQGEELEGPGGFLPAGLLLNTHISRDESYSKQQETLIVWTDRATQLDIALSFQDPEGCEDIWQFILEVQRHLQNHGDEPKINSLSSPLASPLLGSNDWHTPTLATIKEQELYLRMQAKSAAGRERAVEHIIGEDYVKQLIGILHQAEDLESINDLHSLCQLMQTILMFNDNGIFEYILQDDIFIGVLGMLEYDPEFPTLKASYRSFFRQFSKYREVVEIKDETIRNKIHQTSRLMYLKDVVLARMLDDPTFNILNSFVFFNQVDITSYIQSDEALLQELFVDFRPDAEETPRKRDLVLFLHQLMVMGKGVQIQNRLQLYRSLLDRGLLWVCEWAFRQPEAVVLHASAEILTLAVEHDANAVRAHVLRQDEGVRPTLLSVMINLLQSTHDQGLVQQLIEALKTLLEPSADTELGRKDGVVDTFTQHFYDTYATPLLSPLSQVPELRNANGKSPSSSRPLLTTDAVSLPAEHASLLNVLVDILSYCLMIHGHRAQYYILSNPLVQRVCSLMYAREKTLRHSALRFIKACLRTNNHFVHRNFTKNRVTEAILDLVERETDRDTMLSSACLDTLEMIRKDNMKGIIVDIFEKHEPTMVRLAERPYVRPYILALRVRWDQYREPPPPPQATESNQTVSAAEEEEAWFNSDEPVRKRTKPPAQGLLDEYDDASDSEDSPDEALAEELTDVELKVRAKREREEEEEEGALAGLVGKPRREEPAEDPPKDKKIRLSLSALSKKLK